LNGNDVLEFIPAPGESFNLNYTSRSPNQNGGCDLVYRCGNVFLNLVKFTGSNSIVIGNFYGTFYEDKPNYGATCITPDSHLIEGEFNLKLVN
jgi:hypothetical protein